MHRHTTTRAVGRAIALVLTLITVLGLTGTGFARQDGDLNPPQASPALTIGDEGAWDSDYVAVGDVIEYDGVYHMFYNGSTKKFIDPIAIGHATSPDGITWTKDAANPLIVGADVDTMNPYASVAASAVIVVGDTWMLYFTLFPATGTYSHSAIWRATAATPDGPWTVDDAPALDVGGSRRWDNRWVIGPVVLAAGDGYRMYFGGGDTRGTLYGLATSPDGATWQRYDDPATTERAFAESDAIFQPGDADAWDHFLTNFDVWQAGGGWHMLYQGADGTQFTGYGYATSPDGITWTRYAGNPLWSEEPTQDSSAALEGSVAVVPSGEDGTVLVYGDLVLDALSESINVSVWAPPGGG